MMLNIKTRKFFAWCGPITLLLFFSALVIAGFLPPISPSLTQAEIVALYQENQTNILIGMNLLMISAMVVLPFYALITEQLLRIKGIGPSLAYSQLAAGLSGAVIAFALPAIIFMAAAYRIDQSPEIIYFMNDFAWILAILPWPFQFLANILIGLAVLSDKSDNPIFPRWFGFFSFWMAVIQPVGSVIVFVYGGPFAWNGIFPFWLVATVYFAYFSTLTAVLLKAINRQAAEVV